MNITDITNSNCITTNCHNKAVPANGRGLCMGCYSSAKKAVDSGKVTWEQLEEMRLVLRKSDPFVEALERAMRGSMERE